MLVERRGWVIAFEIGSTGNGRNPMFNGRRQPSCGGTSRMTRECQVRICEGLGVKFPGPTRHAYHEKEESGDDYAYRDGSALGFRGGEAIARWVGCHTDRK